jgi:hypothetical protein
MRWKLSGHCPNCVRCGVTLAETGSRYGDNLTRYKDDYKIIKDIWKTDPTIDFLKGKYFDSKSEYYKSGIRLTSAYDKHYDDYNPADFLQEKHFKHNPDYPGPGATIFHRAGRYGDRCLSCHQLEDYFRKNKSQMKKLAMFHTKILDIEKRAKLKMEQDKLEQIKKQIYKINLDKEVIKQTIKNKKMGRARTKEEILALAKGILDKLEQDKDTAELSKIISHKRKLEEIAKKKAEKEKLDKIIAERFARGRGRRSGNTRSSHRSKNYTRRPLTQADNMSNWRDAPSRASTTSTTTSVFGGKTDKWSNLGK